MRYLESLSRDTLDRDLAEGLTEEIIARLSQVSGLQVTSRYASLRYRGRRADPGVVGRELGVRYVIDGTLRRTGGNVRLVLTMADASGGFNVWGQTFERGLADIGSVQDSIALQVARAVRGPGAEPASPPETRSRSASTNADAYQAYLQGVVAIRGRTPAAAVRAAHAYRLAISHDSSFAPAWAGLAHVLALVRDWGWSIPGVPNDSLQPVAGRAAARALALDSNAAASWLAAAMVERANDPDRALAWHHRAVRQDSTSIEARHQLAWGMLNAGAIDSAIAVEHDVIRRDPYYAYAYAGLAQLYNSAGRAQDALAWVAQGLAIDSLHANLYWHLADLQLALGRPREARAAVDRAEGLGYSPRVLAFMRVLIRVREGDTAGVRAQLAELRDSARAGPPGGLAFTTTMVLSGIYAQLGDAAGAVEEGRRLTAWPRRYYSLSFRRHWYWEPIRTDARFQEFIAGLGR